MATLKLTTKSAALSIGPRQPAQPAPQLPPNVHSIGQARVNREFAGHGRI